MIGEVAQGVAEEGMVGRRGKTVRAKDRRSVSGGGRGRGFKDENRRGEVSRVESGREESGVACKYAVGRVSLNLCLWSEFISFLHHQGWCCCVSFVCSRNYLGPGCQGLCPAGHNTELLPMDFYAGLSTCC